MVINGGMQRVLSFDIYTIQKSIKYYGDKNQLIVSLEELSELQKEICKKLRDNENEDKIIEEMADVYIVLEDIKQIFQIKDKDIQREVNYKLNRLEERMKTKDIYVAK